MSYPFGTPTDGFTGHEVWSSGSFTPDDVTASILDQTTSVNKSAIRNSVGYQISLVQNFVNSEYLGRESSPINSGYLKNIYSPESLTIGSAQDIDLDAVNYITLSAPSGIVVNNDVRRGALGFISLGELSDPFDSGYFNYLRIRDFSYDSSAIALTGNGSFSPTDGSHSLYRVSVNTNSDVVWTINAGTASIGKTITIMQERTPSYNGSLIVQPRVGGNVKLAHNFGCIFIKNNSGNWSTLLPSGSYSQGIS